MTHDAEDIVWKARAIVSSPISESTHTQRELAAALLRAVEALGQIRTQAIAEESIHIERLARECLASLGQKP